ncbi:uncharacterized protein PFL1_04559 [Pseudozyma flocculosa PF-1]|uniref:Uncharacterized protein n=1 Tax=Pseudozyma flocculosa PF-1 TaxID=1277687 RepID=A0A061H5T3_9BASI|nr:uncharacterized protein PFL1_04559 [Pseudozyma flocculosa PF-1]EPQ27814.1 hypothetical protein PFL1_04559 [Pseudozyma flocculosa PF-1]
MSADRKHASIRWSATKRQAGGDGQENEASVRGDSVARRRPVSYLPLVGATLPGPLPTRGTGVRQRLGSKGLLAVVLIASDRPSPVQNSRQDDYWHVVVQLFTVWSDPGDQLPGRKASRGASELCRRERSPSPPTAGARWRVSLSRPPRYRYRLRVFSGRGPRSLPSTSLLPPARVGN